MCNNCFEFSEIIVKSKEGISETKFKVSNFSEEDGIVQTFESSINFESGKIRRENIFNGKKIINPVQLNDLNKSGLGVPTDFPREFRQMALYFDYFVKSAEISAEESLYMDK